MTPKTIPAALCLALTAACGQILRTPDANIAPAQSSAEAPAYEISEVIATSEAIARANAMPFLAQVTLGGAGESAARRVRADEATMGQLPHSGSRPTYLIGAGDLLRVSRAISVVSDRGLEAEQASTKDLRVGVDGTIDLIDAGKVNVAGQSIDEARLAIAEAYDVRSSNAGRYISEVEFPRGGGLEYLIGPGDVLSAAFVNSPLELNGGSTAAVGLDGVVTLRQLAPVKVGGLSLSDAREVIRQAALRDDAERDDIEAEFPRGGAFEYRIGPGDVLAASFIIPSIGLDGAISSSVASTSSSVGRDGVATFLQVGPVELAGLTVSEAQRVVSQAALRSNAATEEVQLAVNSYHAHTVIVSGELQSQVLALRPDRMTIDKLLGAAGLVVSPTLDYMVTLERDGATYQMRASRLLSGESRDLYAARDGDRFNVRRLSAQVELDVVSYQSQKIILSGDIGSQLIELRPGRMSIDTILGAAGLVVSPTVDYLVTLERDRATYKMRASRILSGASRGLYAARDGDTYIVSKLSVTPEFSVSVEEFKAHRVSFLDLSSGASAILTLTDEGVDLRSLLLARGVKVTRDSDALVRLMRRGSEYRASARDILLENPGKRVWLEPADDVIVEPLEYVASQAVIVGQVGAPKAFQIDRAARSTVSQALFSGGLFGTPGADFKHIYVLRQRDGAAYDAYHFDLTEVLNIGLADRMELRPGDVIFVRTNPLLELATVINSLISLDPRQASLASDQQTSTTSSTE